MLKKIASVLLVSLPVFAQQSELSGVVRDRSQGAVPAAGVTARNQASGFERSTIASAEGVYSLPNLQPGTYTLELRATGFQVLRQTGVSLGVGQSAHLDFTLDLGSVEQSITVSSEAALLQTDSATISTTVNREFIENLPLNGRSFQSLIEITPGVVATKATFGEQGQFSVNGQRANANYFTIDGVSANIGVSSGLTLVQSGSGSLPGLSATGGTNSLVSVDALEEFQVQTSGYTAEFGRMPGAQITILTRSGSNQLHGSLFDFFRNSALDASDWFAKANRLPDSALRQNDFGGVLGGALKRDKTFFFFSYEGLRLRQPQFASTDVPSLQYRQLAGSSTAPYLNAFPLPNGPANNFGYAQFVATYSDASTLDATSLRLDQSFGSRLSVFGRYNYAPSNYISRIYTLSNPTTTEAATQTLTTGATLIVSPRITNSLRFNYSRSTGESFSKLDNFGGGVPLDPSKFFPSFADPTNSFGGYFLLGGNRSSFYLGKNVTNTQGQTNLVDSVSFQSGSHLLKFGADYRRLATDNNPRAYDLFVYFVSPNGAAVGRSSQTTIDAQEQITVFFHNLSLYGQDTWKISPRLTVNYGLRWELNPAPSGSKQLYTLQGYENPSTIGAAPAGTPLYATSYGNFAPRAGLAWQLSQKPGAETTLRAGFGIFYDLGSGIITQAAAGFPYYRQKNILTQGFWPLSDSDAMPPPFSLKPPIPSIYGAVAGLRLPLTYQWNMGLNRQLGRSNALSVAYVAAAGRHLLRQDFFVNPNDNVTYAYLLKNTAFSDFNSLQVQFQRRLSKGLQALVSYTWAHSLDNASTDSASHLSALQVNPLQDRGPSDFDIRHALSGAFTYNLPGRQRLVKDWFLDSTVTFRTATPIDVTYYADVGFGAYNFRPDLVPGVPLYLADPNVPGGRRFNIDAFQIPSDYPGRQGTLGRNSLRGFPLEQINLSFRREFPVIERARIQFRAEMFNILNHPNFADPSGAMGSTSFGYSTQMLSRDLGQGGVNGGLNPLYQVGGPRSIQLALRMVF
jgi:hypothetical protein